MILNSIGWGIMAYIVANSVLNFLIAFWNNGELSNTNVKNLCILLALSVFLISIQ